MDRLQDIPNMCVERDKLGCNVVTNHLHLSRLYQHFLDLFKQHPHELCTRVVCGFPTVHDVGLILRQNKSNRTTRQARKKLKLWELHLTQLSNA